MPSLHDIINDHKTNRNNSNKWKIQVNMHASFNSFLNDYQKQEIILRNGSGFVFESVDLLSYHVHKTSLKRGKSYIKSPEWVLNKRATINPKNKDNKCFQYSITAALNHQNIGNYPERISNVKPFIDQYKV